MQVNSPWSLNELKARNYIFSAFGGRNLYTTREIKAAVKANPDFYNQSVASAESGSSFTYYLVDKDGDGYPIQVKAFKALSFDTKETFIVTVRESQYDNYVNLLVKHFKKGEHTPLDDIPHYDPEEFHIDEDFKNKQNRTKAAVIKLVVVVAMIALMGFWYYLRQGR